MLRTRAENLVRCLTKGILGLTFGIFDAHIIIGYVDVTRTTSFAGGGWCGGWWWFVVVLCIVDTLTTPQSQYCSPTDGSTGPKGDLCNFCLSSKPLRHFSTFSRQTYEGSVFCNFGGKCRGTCHRPKCLRRSGHDSARRRRDGLHKPIRRLPRST